MRAEVKDWRRPSSRDWPHAGGPWRLTLEWAAGRDGSMICTGARLQLRAGEEPQALTAVMWRKVKLSEEVQRARATRFKELGAEFIEAFDDGAADLEESLSDVPSAVVEAIRAEVTPWSDRRRGRPIHYGPEHYREVARVYSDAVKAGSATPRQAVAASFGTSPVTASRWLAVARDRGLLPKGAPGQITANADVATNESEEGASA